MFEWFNSDWLSVIIHKRVKTLCGTLCVYFSKLVLQPAADIIHKAAVRTYTRNVVIIPRVTSNINDEAVQSRGVRTDVIKQGIRFPTRRLSYLVGKQYLAVTVAVVSFLEVIIFLQLKLQQI